MSRILIIEDELVFATQLKIELEQIGYKVIAVCSTISESTEILNSNEVDAVVIDIQLQGESGLEIAGVLRGQPVIFITQHDESSIYKQASSIPNSGFIVKPFHIYTLDRELQILISKSKQQLIPFIKDGRSRYILEQENIKWIHVNGNYIEIKTTDKNFVFKKSLNQLKQSIDQSKIIQVHRSYMVNKSLITKMNFTDNILSLGEDQIPIGKVFKPALIEMFKNILS